MDGLIARIRSRQLTTAVVAIAGGVLLLLLLLISGPVADLIVDPEKANAQPAGTPEDPFAGNQENTNPVFDTVQNWRELVQVVENEGASWYKECLSTRIGVTWEQAERYASLVDQGHDLRFILVSNSSVNDEEARQRLRDDGITDVDNLPIVRVNGFRNTRGLPSDRCQAFGDDRSQVRVSLAIPVDVNDITKGFRTDKGVLANCSNPWDIPQPEDRPEETTTTARPRETTTTVRRETTTTRPRETTTTRPPETTTTRPPTGKETPPTTVAPPPTTVPPPTTTTQPSNGGQGDAGDGSTNTTSPPTTEAPPPTQSDPSSPTTNPPPPPG